MDLILVRKTSRLNYFRYLYRTGYMNQSPFELPFVEIHRVKEFTYFPKSEDGTKSSVWNCDGEVLDDSRIRVKVHCQVLPVFARGLEKSQDD
jgi:ceramide kinase